jgi:hypothetical protein
VARSALASEQKVNYKAWCASPHCLPGQAGRARSNLCRITAMQVLSDATTAFTSDGLTRFPAVSRAGKAVGVDGALGCRRHSVRADPRGAGLSDRSE